MASYLNVFKVERESVIFVIGLLEIKNYFISKDEFRALSKSSLPLNMYTCSDFAKQKGRRALRLGLLSYHLLKEYTCTHKLIFRTVILRYKNDDES